MFSKNCRLVLDAILSEGESRAFESHRISDLSNETKLSLPSTLAACQELERDGFAVLKIIQLPHRPPITEGIALTEKGAHYKDYLKDQRIDYIKDKWIDFLALAISLIALVKSFWPEILLLLQK